MTNTTIAKTLTILLATILVVSCGPETNSRYGDEYWDPQDTWEAASVIKQPELSIVYRDIDADPEIEDWEGYVSVDFSDLVLKSAGEIILSYTTGTMEKTTLSSFVQAGSTDNDPKFYYNSTDLADYRLKLTEPENYTFYLDFAVVQPNGTRRVYEFVWSDIIIPGAITRDDFWASRVNASVNDNCNSCHGSGGDPANAVFPLDNSTVANLRNTFIDEIEIPQVGRELPTYPFSSTHSGSSNAALIIDDARTDLNYFVNALIQAEADGENIGTNIDLDVIANPTIMEDDPYQ